MPSGFGFLFPPSPFHLFPQFSFALSRSVTYYLSVLPGSERERISCNV